MAIILLKKISNLFGIDQAISYIVASKIITLINYPITIYLISKYFSLTEQGYYYTFNNVLAFSIFLELGLGVVLTQFASHEFAYLKWWRKYWLTGILHNLYRLISLIKSSLKWYTIMSLLLLLLLSIIGLVFFGSDESSLTINYKVPWIVLVFFTCMNFIIYPLIAILEGCNRIAEIQKLKFWQVVFSSIFIWIIILAGGRLYAVVSTAFVSLVINIVWLKVFYKRFLIQVLKSKYNADQHQISWKSEIFPMQWKIALSWTAGFFINQLFNPLLFKYQGPEVAGKMGMSLAIANIPLSISMSWLSTKFPNYGIFIQQNKKDILDSIALKSTKQALIINIILSSGIVLFLSLTDNVFVFLSERILSITSLCALLFSNLIAVITTSMAGYLRAHKKEPFLINSIIMAVVIFLVAWLSAKYFNAEVMTISLAMVNFFIALPFASIIFLRKRIEWHGSR